jgi:glucose dehydrogenase
MTSADDVALSGLPAFAQSAAPANTESRYYAGDLADRRHAPLDQINAGNFNNLAVAWRFKPDRLGSRPEALTAATKVSHR